MQSQAEIQREMAHSIASAESLEDALSAYSLCWSLLKEYKFVFAAKSGGTLGFAVNRSFSGGAAIRGLFHTDHVVVLDPVTVREMASGRAIYPIDYSISLDANTFSYLQPHIKGTGRRPPAEFVEVFNFIARDDVHVDSMPYIIENIGNGSLADPEKAVHIFESLKAYEVLRTLDADWLKSTGEARSKLPDAELVKKTQETISQLFYDMENKPAMKGTQFRFNFMYANLLQMALTQLKRKTWSPDRKLEEYMEFCHSQLATMNARELTLARAYFERGQNLKFFGRIQARRDDLLGSLKNMTWDLVHIRHLEGSMVMPPDPAARYYFPALLTFDQDLIEIMDLCPLKSIAFTSDESQTMPVYAQDMGEIISADPARRSALQAKYYTSEPAADRNARRAAMKIELPSIIAELEENLSAFGTSP